MRYPLKSAGPGAAALLWGSRAHVLQRVQEYHIAPSGITAKSQQKSSIFLRALPPILFRSGRRAFSLSYIDVFGGVWVPKG